MSSMSLFQTRLVGEGIWCIDGPVNDLIHLVIGSKAAMLVDTGMGIGNLAELIISITSLPIIVVNTHGHPDHAGGNPGFEEVWSPALDENIKQKMCTDAFRTNDLKAVLGENNPNINQLIQEMVPQKSYKTNRLHKDLVIDIGGRKFEVIEIPGHTPGSVGLINREEKLLFSGDSIVATPVWLYLEHSLPVKTYRDALRQVKSNNDIKTIYPGHQPTALDPGQLDDLIACADEILEDPERGEPTRTFAGEGLLWVHGKSQIIYDPKKVH